MAQAFFVYNALLFLLVGVWRFGKFATTEPWRSSELRFSLFATFTVIVYSLILGLRLNVGVDYPNYVGYFDMTSSALSPSDAPFEIGFYWLIRLLKSLDLPYPALFVTTCALQIGVMTMWLRSHRDIAPWFFYFYFCTLVLFDSLNIVRQAVAFAFVLFAMEGLHRGSPKRYFGLIACACVFHTSALLFLPGYFFLGRNVLTSTKIRLLILVVSYFAATYLKNYLIDSLSFISGLIAYSNYSELQEDLFFKKDVAGFSAGVLFQFCIDVFIIFVSSRLINQFKSRGYIIYYNLTFIGMIIAPVVYMANYIIFSRILSYFTGFKFVVLSYIIMACFNGKAGLGKKGHILGIIVLVSYYAWFLHAISEGAAMSAPFQFVF